MSIEGLISTSALFHDKDGTTTLKVVNLSSVDGYTDGKVAIVTGTCGTNSVSVSMIPTAYKDASGAIVSLLPTRVAFQASSNAILSRGGTALLRTGGDRLATSDVVTGSTAAFSVQSVSGVASYSLLTFGTEATAPGAPTIVSDEISVGQTSFFFTAPSSDGGVPITSYKVYVDGVDASNEWPADLDALSATKSAFFNGNVQVSAVNAVGEGPLSAVYVISGP